MDQRNAGDSRAPVSGRDGWHSYAEDHLALLDHLNIDQTHLLGGCIGGPYCLGVIKAHRERVARLCTQPIGSDNNRALFYSMFDNGADAIKDEHPEAKAEDWLLSEATCMTANFCTTLIEISSPPAPFLCSCSWAQTPTIQKLFPANLRIGPQRYFD
ncbi:MAG: hypothetical protein CM1200mP9_05440 [Gammaproteobacteria bacterium]|nr:MAG: hypothetical protein CM1200mP9_05440 [Gammaproteobacteria bacterium]